MASVEDIQNANETGIIVAQKLAVVARPWTRATQAAPATLFDAQGIIPGALSGCKSVGLLKKKAGATLTPDTKTSDIESYGKAYPSRRLVQTEGGKLEFGLQEARRIAWEMQTNLKAGNFTTTGTGGWRASKEGLESIRYWTIAVFGQDVNDETLDPIFQWFWFRKVGMDSGGKISLAQDAESMPDMEFGLFGGYDFGIDGPGMAPLLAPMGFTSGAFNVDVGAATAGTFTLTYKGQTTASIAYNATPAAVKSALVALDDGYDASAWTVVAGTGGVDWVVTTPDGDAITGSGSGLTGGTLIVQAVSA